LVTEILVVQRHRRAHRVFHHASRQWIIFPDWRDHRLSCADALSAHRERIGREPNSTRLAAGLTEAPAMRNVENNRPGDYAIPAT
jgi:hypothetical protein